MKYFILLVFWFTFLTASPNVQTKSYEFNLTHTLKGKVILDFSQQKLLVETEGVKNVLTPFSEILDESVDASFIFEDLNLDGYTDIGVSVDIGYGGVNVYRNYYFYDRASKCYILYLKNVSNIEVWDKANRVLRSWEKSGNSFYASYYLLDKHGKPYKILDSIGSWSVNGDMKYSYISHTSVKAKKAYFYDDIEGRRLKSYLIQGDKVEVLDLSLEENGHIWMKVLYRGKRKSYQKWIRFEDFEFGEIKGENEK